MNTPQCPSKSVARRQNAIQNWARILVAANALWLSTRAGAQEPVLIVSTNTYSAYRADLAPGAWVYVDADSAGATPVRAMQRSLGYREVDYKSAVYPTLYFSAVTPTTNGATVTYD